ALSGGQGPKERAVINKICDPVKIHDVMGGELCHEVCAVFRTIGSKRFEMVSDRTNRRAKFSLNVFAPNPAFNPAKKCAGRLVPDNRLIVVPGFAYQHGRFHTYRTQAGMKSIGGSGSASRDIVCAEVNDF
ncbi:MAG: hypothetical protein ACXWWE_07795, partial [Nitrospira sp.]